MGMGGIWALLAATGFGGAPIADVIKARKLVIVDEKGTERVVIADHVPDPKEGKRSNTGSGMVINNKDGFEQFGVYVDDKDGGVGMGFDAKPGVGDPRNRERINLKVSPAGTALIRVLDNSTRVKAWLMTNEKEEAYLGFLRWEGAGRETKYVGEKRYGLGEAKADSR